MNATDHFKAGRLRDAVDAQILEVKAQPSDADRRVFLFELLLFTGELDRARRQVDAIQYDEIERQAALLGYRQLLDSEEARRKVIRGDAAPEFFEEPFESVKRRVEAVTALARGDVEAARGLLEDANEAASKIDAIANGKPATEVRDADDLFGTVLEVMAKGKYYWVPLETVASLAMNPPKFPRDTVYFPAKLQLLDGSTGDVFLPVLYPGSHDHPDDLVKLGRSTAWRDHGGMGPILGFGQKTLLAGEDALGLLELRELQVSAGE